MNTFQIHTNTRYTNIKCYGKDSIYLLSRLYAILYCPSQGKQHVYGNLPSWMMVQAPPTTACLFWFYYNNLLLHEIYFTFILIIFTILNTILF